MRIEVEASDAELVARAEVVRAQVDELLGAARKRLASDLKRSDAPGTFPQQEQPSALALIRLRDLWMRGYSRQMVRMRAELARRLRAMPHVLAAPAEGDEA